MKHIGILLIAHGSRDPKWIRELDQQLSHLKLDGPFAVGFLELVEGRTIAAAVQQLERLGVQKIIAVPLFVCSGSTHLEEIQYALGIKERPLIATEMKRIPIEVEVIWCQVMDADPHIQEIVRERILKLSQRPQEECLLLVAHGSSQPGFRELWQDMLEQMTRSLQEQFAFLEADFATIHPNNIASKGKTLSAKGRLLVVPLFLSEGYYSKRYIPSQLEQVAHVYSGETYLPHPNVLKWIESTVRMERRA